MGGGAPAPPARCPRCGYDLRGATATWRESCPLEDVCTECGLRFSWAEVLRPERFERRWCVEFVTARRIVRGTAATALRSLRPFRFWSALRMSTRIRWRRLAAYLALLMLLVVPCLAAIQVTAAIRLRYVMGRGAAYAGYQVNHSYAAAVAEAVLMPWSNTSSGSITQSNPPRALPYPGPRSLYLTLSWAEWEIAAPAPETAALACLAFWLCLALPPAFVLLPVSRRRARVRWAHLWRITCYGAAIPLLLVSVWLCLVAAGFATTLVPVGTLQEWCGYVAIPMLVIWWAAAIGRYLRMPHAWLVSVLLSFLSLLVLLTLFSLPFIVDLFRGGGAK